MVEVWGCRGGYGGGMEGVQVYVWMFVGCREV